MSHSHDCPRCGGYFDCDQDDCGEHDLCLECLVATLEAEVAEMRARTGEWRPRPPTEADLRAHHETHATAAGVSLWMFWPDDAARPVVVGFGGALAGALLVWWDGPGRWRTLDADGVACPWPVVQESP